MKCPFCESLENKVIDSRLSKNGDCIKRRRECLECDNRFNTYEHIEKKSIMIIKKDGRREEFSKTKVTSGIIKACEKRKISIEVIDNFVLKLEQELEETGKREISSDILGEKIMFLLKSLDDVAYVRFASVYKDFKTLEDFILELKKIK